MNPSLRPVGAQWKKGSVMTGSREAEAARLFQQLDPSPELSVRAMARIEKTLGKRRSRSWPTWSVLRPIEVAAVVGALLVVLTGGVAVARLGVLGIRRWWVASASTVPTELSKAKARIKSYPPELTRPHETAGNVEVQGQAAPKAEPVPQIIVRNPDLEGSQMRPSEGATGPGHAPDVEVANPSPPVPAVAAKAMVPSRPLSNWVNEPIISRVVALSPTLGSAVPAVDSSPPMIAEAQLPPIPVAAPDPLAQEASLVRVALEKRRRGDNAEAISALQAYRRAYPGGAFQTEAELAEVDADLALGDRPHALALIEQVEKQSGSNLPKSAELRMLHAELLEREGRWLEAMPLFEKELGDPVQGERALFGRASCFEALGELKKARRDFEILLERTPSGQFAARARRALGR